MRIYTAVLSGKFLFVASLLAINAISQTNAKLLQSSDLEYLGAFRVPETAEFEVGGTAIAFNPENNSLLATGRNEKTAEISIPTVVKSNNMKDLKTASILQKFTDITEGKLPSVNPNDPNGKSIGGVLFHGGKMVTTGWAYYDANNTQKLSHFSSSTKIAETGDLKGPFQVGTLGAGFVSGYMSSVPAEWRDSLGGPALTGQCCIPIVTRTSAGPALSVFDPNDLGVAGVVPATPLVYYSKDHQTLGNYGASGTNPVYNGTSSVNGMIFPEGTRSVLFIGRHGIGEWCYGEGSTCGDKADASKGNHAFPYVYQVWAYDALDLVKVKKGQKKPWEIIPYAVWKFNLPYENANDMHEIGGATYDPATQRLYVTQLDKDLGSGYFYGPVFHVFKVNATGPSSSLQTGRSGLRAAMTMQTHADKSRITLALNMAPGAVAKVGIFDLAGNAVADLTPRLQAGKATWDASRQAAGMYVAKAQVNGETLTRQIPVKN